VGIGRIASSPVIVTPSAFEKAMKENNVTAIPDSDVTLQLVQENQQKAKDQLAIIKAAKVKKIVRL